MTTPIESHSKWPASEWVPVARPIESLVEDLDAVRPGGIIRIFCGEANPTVYNDHHFLTSVRHVTQDRGARLHVITGPVILVDSYGMNGLILLKEEGVIERLAHRRARYAAGHFRVVETERTYRYYAECPHDPLLAVEQRHCADLRPLRKSTIQKLAKEAIHIFDNWATDVIDIGTIVELDSGPRVRLPLLATPDDFQTILKEAADKQLIFDYLDVADLLDLGSGTQLL